MSVSTPPSSTSDISSVTNSTKTMEVQTSATDEQQPSASIKPKCCPPAFRIKRSKSEPIPPKDADPATATDPAPAPAPAPTTNDTQQLLRLITKDIEHIKKASKDLSDYGSLITAKIEAASKTLEKLNRATKTPNPELTEELRKLKKEVMKMKLQIPYKYKRQSAFESKANKDQRLKESSSTLVKTNLPNLFKNEKFEQDPAFIDFKALYGGLDIQKKVCLLSFSIFPEHEIIKKRFMLYWWIGEGFVGPTPEKEKTAEDSANEIFHELMSKGFIEPYKKKGGMEVSRCTMHPLVRTSVVMLADRAKVFHFDPKGKPTGNFSKSLQACLLEAEKLKDSDSLEKIHMLFNVDETILEFEKPEMFSKMKNINVFCLGRWKDSQKHHIEVEDTVFLEGLKNMKHLKFLSLQGISRIMKLPDCISNLANLTILDLRSCQNLEEIPDKIGQLKSLTHLDMSECYLLDNMPKGLSSLSELQVLKGFVVGYRKGKNSCTLQHLANLPKLRKLSIRTSWEDFPKEEDLRDLNRFNVLLKLTIAWGGASPVESNNNAKSEKNVQKSTVPHATTEPQNRENRGNDIGHDNTGNVADSAEPRATANRCNISKLIPKKRKGKDASDSVPPQLPTQLEKLDLKCFPKTCAPHWLKARNLKNIKKLYIRGGTLGDLGQFQSENEWKVEILRLKYLNELEIDWKELQELFPNLKHLEKVKCPKLTLFPCDGHGFWVRKP